jgi:flavoprotein
LVTDAAVYAGKNWEVILVVVLDSAECCLVQKNQRIVREKECPKTSTKKEDQTLLTLCRACTAKANAKTSIVFGQDQEETKEEEEEILRLKCNHGYAMQMGDDPMF